MTINKIIWELVFANRSDFFTLKKVWATFECEGKILHHNALTDYQYWRGENERCDGLTIYSEIWESPTGADLVREGKRLAHKYKRFGECLAFLSANPQFDEWDMNNRHYESPQTDFIDWNLHTVLATLDFFCVTETTKTATAPKFWKQRD